MKTLTAAAALLALLVAPANAQMGGGAGRHHKGGDTKTDQKPKVDEKAYQDALKRIPDSKEKYDPWSGARPSTDQKQGK
jgi:hypothetical protein